MAIIRASIYIQLSEVGSYRGLLEEGFGVGRSGLPRHKCGARLASWASEPTPGTSSQ